MIRPKVDAGSTAGMKLVTIGSNNQGEIRMHLPGNKDQAHVSVDAIGQGQYVGERAARGSNMDGFGNLRDQQALHPAIGQRGAQNHRTAVLITCLRRKGVGTGSNRAVEAGAHHAALDLAEIMSTGDDFLPRITPFLKTHATDVRNLEIDHLRDKCFLSGSDHAGNAGAYLRQMPFAQRGLRPQAGQPGFSLIGRHHQNAASGIEAERHAVLAGCETHRLIRPYCNAQQANLYTLGGNIRQFDLAAQDIHRELFEDTRQDVGRQLEQVVAAFAPDQETRNHAPLGGAECRAPDLSFFQMRDVIGQEIVQKTGGIFTAGADQSMVGKANGRCGSHDGKLRAITWRAAIIAAH